MSTTGHAPDVAAALSAQLAAVASAVGSGALLAPGQALIAAAGLDEASEALLRQADECEACEATPLLCSHHQRRVGDTAYTYSAGRPERRAEVLRLLS